MLIKVQLINKLQLHYFSMCVRGEMFTCKMSLM